MSISHERIAPRCLPGKVISSVDGSERMARSTSVGTRDAADVQMRHRRRAHTRQNRADTTRDLGHRNGSIRPAWRTAPWRHEPKYRLSTISGAPAVSVGEVNRLVGVRT